MVKMDHLLDAAQWICRRVRALCSIPPSPKVAGGSLSSTAPTPTMICHLRPCPATPPSTVRGKQPRPQHHTPDTFYTDQLHNCSLPCVIYPILPNLMSQYWKCPPLSTLWIKPETFWCGVKSSFNSFKHRWFYSLAFDLCFIYVHFKHISLCLSLAMLRTSLSPLLLR